MTDGPLLWYLNRATGVVLLVLLTLSVVLGVLSMGVGRPGRGLPRFVPQALHRNVALLSVVALAVHVATAVADSYVDIRWWQAVVPFGAAYEPVWLGFGALALDLVAVVVVTSLLRSRLSHGAWRSVHVLAWAAWAASVVHTLGIGTDAQDPGGLAAIPLVLCVGAVAAAFAARLSRLLLSRTDPSERTSA